MLRPLLLVAAVLASASLGACSDKKPASVATTVVTVALQNPCELVRLASVEQTLGKTFRPSVATENNGRKQCVFDTTDGTGSIEIEIAQGTEGAFAQLRRAYPDPVKVTTSADEAFWSERLHTLIAREGVRVITVSLNLRDAPENILPQATDLAEEALNEL